MSLIVLSCNFGHDGSASIIKDRKLVAHIASERITRKKKQRGVTPEVIDYVLQKAQISFNDVDIVAVNNWYWDRNRENTELFNKTAEGFHITDTRGTDYNFQDYENFHRYSPNSAQGTYIFHYKGKQKLCMLVKHHFSHCAYSYYMSPFDEAISFSLDVNDNMGNNHSMVYFNDQEQIPFYRILRQGGDFNVGRFYSEICDYLGFYPSLTDAGKVMALSAFWNKESSKHILENDELEQLVWPNVVKMGDVFHGDQYLHLLTKLGIKKIPSIRSYFPQLKGEGGLKDSFWLNKKDWNSDLSLSLACYTQYILEKSVYNMISYIDDMKITQNVCLSGGTFLNCVMNGILTEKFPNLNIWIAPSAGDDGLTIGSGLFIANSLDFNKEKQITQKVRKKNIHTIRENIEGGKSYSNKEILDTIKEYKGKIIFKKYEEDELYKNVSNFIQSGKIVGWFQGGSEIGARALGYRSILVDPRNDAMKNHLNDKVKHRESFRPFACSFLGDDEIINEYFPLLKENCPFMIKSFKCERYDKIPSGIHVDKTSRLQTVKLEDNRKFYRLIEQFYKDTEVPALINTSFNVMGEPIVESPKDAIECFLKTNIDYLIVENYIIEK